MSSIFDRHFLVQTAERAVKTFFQGFVAALVGAGTGLLDTDWVGVLSVAAMAALISVGSSIGSGYVGDDSPSLVD